MRPASISAWPLSVGVFVALAGAPGTSRADDADVCIAAAESSQTLLRSGKLLEARTKLVACRAARCPAVVRSDCEKWNARLEDDLPTVIFAITDVAGRDVVDATVRVDGTLVQSPPGRAIELDPGNHEVRVDAPERGSATLTVTAREGEKKRMVGVRLELPREVRARPESPRPSSNGPPIGSWISWGLGAIALGTGGVLGGLAATERSELEDRCGTPTPRCTPDDVSGGRALATGADVALGIGAAAVVVGFVWWALAPASTSDRARSGRAGLTF